MIYGKNVYCLLVVILAIINFISCSNKLDRIIIEENEIKVVIEEKKLENICDEEILSLINKSNYNEFDDYEEEYIYSNKYTNGLAIKVISKEIEEDFLVVNVQIKDDNGYIEQEYYMLIEDGKVKIDSAKIEENKNKYIEFEELIKEDIYNIFNNIKGDYSIAFKDIEESDTLSINNKKMPSASTIKIYIMIEAYNQINQGKINRNEIITITESMIVGGAGVIQNAEIGTEYKIDDLIKLMMIESDNIATNILINKLGINNINKMIKKLGCVDTELNRKMMDFEAINNGLDNYTSVNDLALVLNKLYNGKCINSDFDNEMLDIMKEDKAVSKIANKLPADTIVANKSGELQNIENDAAIIYTEEGSYILCVLTEDGTSEEQVSSIRGVSKKIYEDYIIYKRE